MSQTYTVNALQLALVKLGWVKIDSQNNKADLWVPGSNSHILNNLRDPDDIGIYLPRDEESSDFSFNLERAVRELNRVSLEEVNEVIDLAEKRLHLSLDEFEVTSDTPHGVGIVPWNQGMNLVQGARSILDVSARTAQGNKRHYAQSSHVVASNFLDGCYMGQTKVGSYVVTALIPAQKKFTISDSKDTQANASIKGRTISETMIASLEAAHEVVEQYSDEPDDELIEWGVVKGLSFELFKGIDEVLGDQETELAIEFLPLGLEPDEQSIRKQVTFSPKHKSVISHAREVLSRAPKPVEVQLSGEVTSLSRRYGEPGSARIKLKANFQEKQRMFTVRLSERDYESAVEAHKAQMQLGIVGIALHSEIIEISSVFQTNAPVGNEIDRPADNQDKLF